MPKPAPKRYTAFQEFYPYYMSEHQYTTGPVLHFTGTGLLILVALALVLGEFQWLLLEPVIGYSFALGISFLSAINLLRSNIHFTALPPTSNFSLTYYGAGTDLGPNAGKA